MEYDVASDATSDDIKEQIKELRAFKYTKIDLCKGTNFVTFIEDLKAILVPIDCWEILTGQETIPDPHEDPIKIALYQAKENCVNMVLTTSLAPKPKRMLKDLKTPFEKYQKIKEEFVMKSYLDVTPIRRKLYNLKFDPYTQTIHTYLKQFDIIVEELKLIGNPMQDNEVKALLYDHIYDSLGVHISVRLPGDLLKNATYEQYQSVAKLAWESVKHTWISSETTSTNFVNENAQVQFEQNPIKPLPAKKFMTGKSIDWHKKATCFNCGNKRHISNNCPNPKKPCNKKKKPNIKDNPNEE